MQIRCCYCRSGVAVAGIDVVVARVGVTVAGVGVAVVWFVVQYWIQCK